jgi:hypothetical protein
MINEFTDEEWLEDTTDCTDMLFGLIAVEDGGFISDERECEDGRTYCYILKKFVHQYEDGEQTEMLQIMKCWRSKEDLERSMHVNALPL